MKNENIIVSFAFIILIFISILLKSTIMIPVFLFLALYLFYPFRKNPMVNRVFVVISFMLVIWFWKELKTILLPFVLALFLAYLFDPIIDVMEKKMKRGFAVAIFMFVTVVSIVLFFVFLIPMFIEEVNQLISLISKNQNTVFIFIKKHFTTLVKHNIVKPELLTEKLNEIMHQLSGDIVKLFSGVGAVFGYLFNLVIIPIVTFYLLKDYDKIRKWFFNRFSKDRRTRIEKGYETFNMIFGKYVRGVMLDSSFVGTLTFLGMTLFGIPYALFIGIVTMLFNVLPYIGIWISLSISELIVLLNGGQGFDFLKVIIVYALVQTLEGTVIYPKIMGKMIGLHPVVIMIMLLILSHFWGIAGLLIGIPTVALIWFWIEDARLNKKENEV